LKSKLTLINQNIQRTRPTSLQTDGQTDGPRMRGSIVYPYRSRHA